MRKRARRLGIALKAVNHSTMNPVRLYVGEQYREPKLFTHTELMFPFWGITAKESMPYVRAAKLQYQYSKADFALSKRIEDADYVHIPYSYERLKVANPERLAMIIKEAHEAKKPLLIDGAGDLEYPINIANATILRVSQFRYRAKPNEVTVPFPAEDLLESYYDGELQLREKPQHPSVGFTGWASMSLTTRLKTEMKELPTTLASMFDRKRGAERKGLFFRERALGALARTTTIHNHFTTRATYSGNLKTITGNVADNRRQFIENLIDSDYALAVRGDANSSVRFYEALSLGRIPLFLDTACVLPLEERIPYQDFCVFVDWKDTDRIGEKLLEFHASVTPERFKEMQQQARAAYHEHLRMDSFSHRLADELRRRLRT
jgi:hypothetical protein